MKKMTNLLLITSLMLFATFTFAQVTDPADPLPSVDWSVNFGNLALIASFSIVITGVINKVINITNSIAKAIISWVVAIGTVFLGNAFEWGIVANTDIITTILTGIGVGFIANLGYDNVLIGYILELIKLKLPRKNY